MTSTKDRIAILPSPAGAIGSSSPKTEATKPAHWENVKGTAFRNPWLSYRNNNGLDGLKVTSPPPPFFNDSLSYDANDVTIIPLDDDDAFI